MLGVCEEAKQREVGNMLEQRFGLCSGMVYLRYRETSFEHSPSYTRRGAQ